MAFIKTQEDFARYICRIILENKKDLKRDLLLPLGVYVQYAYGEADRFTWAIKNDHTLLYEDNFFNWIRYRNDNTALYKESDKIITDEFLRTLENLKNIPGIYSFWNKTDICLYVGVSKDLGPRIIASFNERFKHYVNPIFLKYYVCKNPTDAYVLETIAIAILKPVLNTFAKHEGELTLKYELPELSDKIQCNLEGEKTYVKSDKNNSRMIINYKNEHIEDLLPELNLNNASLKRQLNNLLIKYTTY